MDDCSRGDTFTLLGLTCITRYPLLVKMKNQPEAVIPDPQNMCSRYCVHFTGL